MTRLSWPGPGDDRIPDRCDGGERVRKEQAEKMDMEGFTDEWFEINKKEAGKWENKET